MLVNLRKAAALCSTLEDMLNSIQLAHTVEVSEFDNPEILIEEAHSKFMASEVRHSEIMRAIYDIRTMIGAKNAECGVSAILTELEYIKQKIKFTERYATTVGSTDQQLTKINGKLEKIKNAKEVQIYGDSTVSAKVLTSADVDRFVKETRELKKQQRLLKDRLLELNVSSEITLSERMVDLLTTEGII